MVKRLLLNTFCLLMMVGCNGKKGGTEGNLLDFPVDSIEGIVSTEPKAVSVEFNGKAFLKAQQGTWVCYKYQKDDREDELEENYAKEFSKYAYFELLEDTLSAVGRYKTPIYAYKYPVDFKKYQEESVFITYLNPQTDSLIFIAPYNSYDYYWEHSDNLPYYSDSPMNDTQLFMDDNFIVSDRGYFFFFRKGSTPNSKYITGVPGDARNYFKVMKNYPDAKMNNLLEKVSVDFPYGVQEIMTDYNKDTFENHDWKKEKTLKLEKSQSNGKFVMLITVEGKDISLSYYLADDVEDEDYQG